MYFILKLPMVISAFLCIIHSVVSFLYYTASVGCPPGLKGINMHELSIVTYVIRQVEELAQEHQLSKVSSVTLEFGEVSGIVPEYLVDCWNWYAKKTPLIEGAQLLTETIPAVTWCDSCKKTYPTLKYGKTCPYCGSAETWLQQGSEMNIKQIEAM